jgi:hypothetical protein
LEFEPSFPEEMNFAFPGCPDIRSYEHRMPPDESILSADQPDDQGGGNLVRRAIPRVLVFDALLPLEDRGSGSGIEYLLSGRYRERGVRLKSGKTLVNTLVLRRFFEAPTGCRSALGAEEPAIGFEPMTR